MPKELLLYSSIYDYTASQFISSLEENKGKSIKCRINSGGGQVASTYGMCAKAKEHGNVHMHVDGVAFSGAFNLLMYAKIVTCLSVSTFLLHRADMYATTDEEKAFVSSINADLRAQMMLKVPESKLLAVTGYTYDQVFATDTRLNVFLDANQMKALGIVEEIEVLSPSAMLEIEKLSASMMNLAASGEGVKLPEPNNSLKTFSTMTKDKLKAENPELFNQILAEGAAMEKDRVEAILVFNEIDPAGCKAAIESGKPLTQKQMADFAMKIHSSKDLGTMGKENPPPLPNGEEPAGKTPEALKEKELSAFFGAAVETAKNLG